MQTLTHEVCTDIAQFLDLNMVEWRREARNINRFNDDDIGIELTVATNDIGDTWSFQTGDNSFTGGCYSLPHWAVTWINDDSNIHDIYKDIIDQLEELLPGNR